MSEKQEQSEYTYKINELSNLMAQIQRLKEEREIPACELRDVELRAVFCWKNMPSCVRDTLSSVYPALAPYAWQQIIYWTAYEYFGVIRVLTSLVQSIEGTDISKITVCLRTCWNTINSSQRYALNAAFNELVPEQWAIASKGLNVRTEDEQD